jgi:hypothetical protein
MRLAPLFDGGQRILDVFFRMGIGVGAKDFYGPAKSHRQCGWRRAIPQWDGLPLLSCPNVGSKGAIVSHSDPKNITAKEDRLPGEGRGQCPVVPGPASPFGTAAPSDVLTDQFSAPLHKSHIRAAYGAL